MKISDRFFEAAKSFQDKREAINAEFENISAKLEQFKGSWYYRQHIEEAETVRRNALEEGTETYKRILQNIIADMRTANAGRKEPLPTAEQLAVVNLLQNMESVTEQDLSRASEMLKDNRFCLRQLDALANSRNIKPFAPFATKYTGKEQGLSKEFVDNAIDILAQSTNDFLATDKTRGGRAAARFVQEHYGVVGTTISKRPLFNTKTECFHAFSMMDQETAEAFFSAIDGTEK